MIIIKSARSTNVVVVFASQFMFIVKAYNVLAFTILTTDEIAVNVGSSQVEK